VTEAKTISARSRPRPDDNNVGRLRLQVTASARGPRNWCDENSGAFLSCVHTTCTRTSRGALRRFAARCRCRTTERASGTWPIVCARSLFYIHTQRRWRAAHVELFIIVMWCLVQDFIKSTASYLQNDHKMAQCKMTSTWPHATASVDL